MKPVKLDIVKRTREGMRFPEMQTTGEAAEIFPEVDVESGFVPIDGTAKAQPGDPNGREPFGNPMTDVPFASGKDMRSFKGGPNSDPGL